MQNAHPVDKSSKVFLSRCSGPCPRAAALGRTLSLATLECTGHPRGSGLLATEGWFWWEASVAGVTAGLAVELGGSAEAWAATGGERLAETDWKHCTVQAINTDSTKVPRK